MNLFTPSRGSVTLAHFVLCLGVQSTCEAGALKDLLLARETAVETFRAEVSQVVRAGADRRRLSQDLQLFARWLKTNMPGKERNTELNAEAMWSSSNMNKEYQFRYYSHGGERIRIESYGLLQESPRKDDPVVHVFTGNKWQEYFPLSRMAPTHSFSEMTVHSRKRDSLPQLEVARGCGVPVNQDLEQMDTLNDAERCLAFIGWSKLLGSIAKRMEETTDVVPEGSKTLPVLVVTSTEFKNVGMGEYRVRIWFDSTNEFTPVVACCESLEPPNVDVEGFHYLVSRIVEWRDYVRSSSGLLVPGTARIRFFQRFAKPRSGVESINWPSASYEVTVHEFTFSDIATDLELHEELFDISPTEGTNVVDEPAGERYIIGSAGEQLNRSALRLRERIGPSEPKSRWRIASFVLLATMIMGALAWRFARR